MPMPNLPFVSVNAVSTPAGDFKAPNNASVEVSDYFAYATSATDLTFHRPLIDGSGFEATNPGARVRFVTNASRIDAVLRYTNLVTRIDTYNGLGAVLVDGSLYDTFDRGPGAASDIIVTLNFGTSASRSIELVMPYCASVSLRGVYVTPGATFTTPPARPSTRYLAIGDSITHGFNGTAQWMTWPALLAAAKGWQLFNHGYGGRTLQPTDATDAVTGMPAEPTIATYLIGFNNFYPQTDPATFRTNYDSFISNFRAAAPSCKLYCVTPTWTNHVPGDGLVVPGSNLIDHYRQKIRDAILAASDSLTLLVEGTSLATGDLTHFPDGIHPTDATAAQIAASLAGIMTV